MTDLVFRDPPPPKKLRRNWKAIAEQLKANPGQWACIEPNATRPAASNIAHRIVHNAYRAFAPAGAFEAACRESETLPGRFEAYARFVGNLDGLS